VESVAGEGTTFTIKLPLAETVIRPKDEEVRSVTTEGKKASILVVEDEEEVRELLSDILLTEGHEVITAADGTEGVELFKSNHFDMVLTDLGMPKMSGWQVAEEIKKINGNTPVVLITGWGIEINDSEIENRGVDLVVNKPFRVDQVMQLVQQQIEIRAKAGNE
jgi:CheY-like chemotaxis protein